MATTGRVHARRDVADPPGGDEPDDDEAVDPHRQQAAGAGRSVGVIHRPDAERDKQDEEQHRALGEGGEPRVPGQIGRDAREAVDGTGRDADREIPPLVLEPLGEDAPDVDPEERQKYRSSDGDRGVGEQPRKEDGPRRITAADERRCRAHVAASTAGVIGVHFRRRRPRRAGA